MTHQSIHNFGAFATRQGTATLGRLWSIQSTESKPRFVACRMYRVNPLTDGGRRP